MGSSPTPARQPSPLSVTPHIDGVNYTNTFPDGNFLTLTLVLVI